MVSTRGSFVDEREDIQKKAFTKWINNQLNNSNSIPTITNLFQDLRDGAVLLRLLETLTGNEYKREIGKMRVHHIGNVNKVIAVLGEYGIKLLSISSNDIVDGNPKLTLALIWSIIQYWQGKDVLKSVVPNPEQTNIEKFLLSWCQQQTKGYKGVAIKDFTHSWQDGLAFNALIHKFRPDLFNYDGILQETSAKNLEHAFSIAKNVYKIDRYLDVEDVLSEYPDKKSILMYIMCMFQQMPTTQIVIIDNEEKGQPMMKNGNMTVSMESKFPFGRGSLQSDTSLITTPFTPSTNEFPPVFQSAEMTTYQTNMENTLRWILKLEDELDRQDNIATNDLKLVKDQFQKHENFMINLTKDQNQIGQVLSEGNQLLTSSNTDLQPREENEIKEQMKILNRQWESLRAKSLERQSNLHKMLMKLQIDQIESFDTWLSLAEKRITSQLNSMEPDLPGVERQYRLLAQLQDELVAQQQMTESLQNMVIVIDDSSANGTNNLTSKYTSTEIESKLSNLSERWANMCTFVQNRWIQLQEVKIELEQVQFSLEKFIRWITRKEDEVAKMIAEPNLSDTDILMQQAHAIKKTELEMDDIRQCILALDRSLKVLSGYYDNENSNHLKNLNSQINTFEQRWAKLIDNLELCSARLRKSTINIETKVKTNSKPENDTIQQTIITTVEETTVEQRKIPHDNSLRQEFDLSARKFIDWMDSIEKILDDKQLNNLNRNDVQDIVQEVKTKYLSYDDQFKALIQTGLTITKQLKETNEKVSDHESFLHTLERRWQELFKQIINCERNTEQLVLSSKFDEECQALTKALTEYQTWINSAASTSSSVEMQVKSKSFQSYNERLASLRRMASHIDTKTVQRTDELLRSWEETHKRLREHCNRIESIQQPSGTTGFGATSSHRTVVSPVLKSATITEMSEATSSSATATATRNTSNVGTTGNENGNVFTLTNIYTFGDQGNAKANTTSDKYRVKSFVEVFDAPISEQRIGFERNYNETFSSSSVKRQILTSSNDTHDYYEPSNFSRQYKTTDASLTTYATDELGSVTTLSNASSLPPNFLETQRKLRQWLEEIEQKLLNDKVRICDLQVIDAKKKMYKDLLDQTLERERTMEELNLNAREQYTKVPADAARRLQEELNNYQDRLYDVKMFLTERLTKYSRVDKTLTDFERGIDEVKVWIRNVQPRLNTNDTTYGDSHALENQLGRSQILQQEIREMQTTINRLNKDVVDLTQDADENLARHLRDQMKELNESWSHIISSTKTFSLNIQEALKRNKAIHEEIQELEEWIMDKEHEAPADDGPIFYQDQIRERLEQYQKVQSELSLKENIVRNLVLHGRQDLNLPSSSAPELAQSLETLVSNWTNLQKKVDTKVVFYTDIYTLHEELKNLLHQENVWLDTLQNKIFSSTNNGADAEEISEELDTIERYVKTHSKTSYEKIFEMSDRLQATKVSLPATNTLTNQFRMRWEQLHDDAYKKIHTLNSQISDYQHMGHQITAMFEWMKHTDSTLNARLKDDVYADDVPGEAEKLIIESNQYEAFLRSIDDKVHVLRNTGKTEAAKRLEQQLILLRNQFLQLQTKFRQFQKPSDFEPKHAKMRQILNDIEQNINVLEIHSDDPDVIHNQLEHCLKLYKTLSDIKSEVEYVIRTGRGIVEKRQIDEPNDLTKQIDKLKAQYNTLGAKVSASKVQLDNVERHLRKFRKEYSHIHEWFVKADNEIRKIENKQISKNTKEETDWIRTTRNDIKKLENNFETLKNLDRTIQKEVDRTMPTLQDRIVDLKRQIDQLDRRLKDRSEIIESEKPHRYHNLLYIPFGSGHNASSGASTSPTDLIPIEYVIYPIGIRQGQVRKLEDEYQRFIHIYQEIIMRLEKLETLLSDAERIVDLNRISQVQDELRSVRTQLDELLNLGQDLVSKSEKYSKLVAPDIENITRKFEELQRRIRIIQETQEKRLREQQIQHASTATTTTAATTTTTTNNIQEDHHDDLQREHYSEKRYNRFHRESRRSPSESSDISTAHGVIDEEFKKKYLRCLAYMKLIERLYENQPETDEESETVHRRLSRRERTLRERPEYEEIEKIIRETEERAYVIEKTDVDQANRIREKIHRLRDCLENLKYRSNHYQNTDEVTRYEERVQAADRTVPKEREFDSDFIYDIDDARSVFSEPAPQFNAKYRKAVHSLDRYKIDDQTRYVPTSEEYHLQPLLRVRSLKAIDHHTISAPSSPVLQARYRSHERPNAYYRKQYVANQQGYQDNYQHNSISKSASMPNGGFPVQGGCVPQQPVLYRERVIDRHVAERNASSGESHQQKQRESSGSTQANSAALSGQTQAIHRTLPVRYEAANGASSSYRHTNGYRHEPYPTYFYNEQQQQQQQVGGRSSSYRQPPYAPHTVGPHPTRIVY
ncbi:unnamed protein product [Rotaria socialis]|uniref:Calponin-homology (CH) domain-containing protein n=1 Tax=Rotaria socialis TaxID=392032 RepID=A0A818UR77_9BILA|nr:unnamed protein product [Rotaria socialis]